MRKILAFIFITFSAFVTQAQLIKQPINNNLANKNPGQLHCGTMDELEYNIKNNPIFKQKYEENLKRLKEMEAKGEKPADNIKTEACQPLTDTVIIPVVIHVVGPAAMQTLVTDAVIQSQIDVLNEDYEGGATNFAKTPAHFQSIFGKSKLKFTLAKRNAFDEPFNGISRKTTTATYTQSTYEDVKQASTGGDDALDPLRFLNIWVVTFTDNLLGISVFPGDPRPIKLHGFVCEYRAFGKGYSHLYSSYNGGRTTTHELGHYFNLYHIWGDDVSGAFGCPSTPACSSSDFRANPYVVLPIGTDDTPNQCGATGGTFVPNTTAIITDPCSPNAPGINYQNYMDYTNDAGLCMFSIGQYQRILGCFNSPDRGPLLCSNGYIPPNAKANDATVRQIISPDSNSAYCSGMAPVVIVRNSGTNSISSFKLNVVSNGTLVQTQQVNTAILPFTETSVTLATLTNSLIGTNQLTVYLSDLNGNGVDEAKTNDTARTKYLILSPINGPIVEGFESTTFPPANWRVINPDAGSVTWKRAANVAKTGVGSAYIAFYNYPDIGQKDYLVAPPLNAAGDTIYLSFSRAYKTYSTSTADFDELSIVASTDCGQTFPITLWKKSGNQLATVSGVTGNVNWAPANSTEWATETINIKPLLGNNQNITIAFATTNNFGQNLFLDDINIRNVFIPARDVVMDRIIAPFNNLCSKNLTPSVQIKNMGKDTLKSVKVTYTINNGTPVTETWTGALPYQQTTVYTFKNETVVPATGTFKTWVSEPNALNDLNTLNDTSSVSFRVIDPTVTPLVQGFEDATTIPLNWTLNPSNTTYSWGRTTIAKKDGIASLVMRNRAYKATGAIDEIRTPSIIPPAGTDSVFLKFDVSHAVAIYAGSDVLPKDTLEVLITKDCGKTYTSIYKKTGLDLQTDIRGQVTTSTDTIGFVPVTPQQWRTDSLNISNLVLNSGAGSFIVVFRNISNNGNNVYIDNVNVTSKIVPAKVKQNGYMIAPNPFNGTFFIQHYIRPSNLKSIQVYSTSGQLVADYRYNLDANSMIGIDMNRQSAGIYIVKMIYTDHVVTERVIKTN